MTYGIPGYVEEVAKVFIKNKIEEKTNEKIDNLELTAKNSKLVKFAAKLMKNQETEINKLKNKIKSKAHEKLAAIIAEMKDLNCECRQIHAQKIKMNYVFKIVSLKAANEKLIAFMKTKYMEVVNNLKIDLRIFTGSNTIIFLFLLLLSFLKPNATFHLLIPGVLLFISTIACSYFYLFEQNWFFTLIYNDFIGYGYLGYVGTLFLFLCDIAFNKGRVTVEIINTILEVVGSTLSVPPC